MDRPKLSVPFLDRPSLKPTYTDKPTLWKSMYEQSPARELHKITIPYPKTRKLKQLKGLLVCPLIDALPDPHFPLMKVNLEILKWATVLNGKIIFSSPTKEDCERWQEQVQRVLNNLAEAKAERMAKGV